MRVISFHPFIKKKFYKNQRFNFPAKIYEIQKNAKKLNYLFQKDPQISSKLFFDESYIFQSIHQKFFHDNKKFNLPTKIYEIRKIILEAKLFILKKPTTLV